MRFILCFFIFIAIVGIGLSRELAKSFGKPSEASVVTKAPAPERASASMPDRRIAAASAAASGRTVRLDSDSRGHFQVDARIDGRSIDLIVDTGASLVVINESAAARLGIFPKPSDYIGRSQTANGVSKFAPVMLNRVEVNGITVYNVQAAVKPDDKLSTNLLGMSFLSRVKWSHDRGRLVLEQ